MMPAVSQPATTLSAYPAAVDAQVRRLLRSIEQGLVVPIIGPELLTVRTGEGEVPLYRFLAERLAERLDIQTSGLRPDFTLNDVACKYLSMSQDENSLYQEIDLLFVDKSLQLTPPEPLRKLAKIGKFRLFVTTTFDTLMEQALNEARYSRAARTEIVTFTPRDPKDLPADWKQRKDATVFHLFGRHAPIPGEYVVTEADALEFVHGIQKQSGHLKALFDELDGKQLLLLGCEFPDWFARFFIRAARGSSYRRAGLGELLADRHSYDDTGLRGFLGVFRKATNVVPADAVGFVDKLYDRWCAEHPDGASESTVTADAPVRASASGIADVFISYASEDRAAAQQLFNALSEKLNVWMDRKGGLAPADNFKREIIETLGSCRIFIPIISKTSAEQDDRFYREEWNLAIRRIPRLRPDTRFIAPVIVDEVPVNHPGVPREFWELNAQKLPDGVATPEFVDHVVKMVRNRIIAQRHE